MPSFPCPTQPLRSPSPHPSEVPFILPVSGHPSAEPKPLRSASFQIFSVFVGWLMIFSIFLTTTGFGETTETPQRPSRGVIANVPTGDPYWGNALVLERPDTNARRLGALQNGTEVTLAESSGYYTRITSPKAGWVGTRLITITETEPVDPKAPETIDSLIFNSQPEKKLNDLTDPQKTYKPYVSETVDFTQFGPLPTPGPTGAPTANGDPAAVSGADPSAPPAPTPANPAP